MATKKKKPVRVNISGDAKDAAIILGRDVELASLHEMLQRTEAVMEFTLGDRAASQLTVENAHVYRDDYPSEVFC